MLVLTLILTLILSSSVGQEPDKKRKKHAHNVKFDTTIVAERKSIAVDSIQIQQIASIAKLDSLLIVKRANGNH